MQSATEDGRQLISLCFLFCSTETQLVELKNGETFNGHLIACDNFMNLTLREVYQTSAVSLRGSRGEALVMGSGVYARWSSEVVRILIEPGSYDPNNLFSRTAEW